MTHAELQAMVCQLAHIMGWRWLHVRRSIGKGHRWATTTNIVGWPDLILWSHLTPQAIHHPHSANGRILPREI